MKMYREKALDEKKAYIFGYHPHGIFTTGALVGFGSEALGVSHLIPKINIHLLGLESVFKIPFYRDFAILMGCLTVSKSSIENILGKGPGNACVIVVGGAQEALLTKPELPDLVLMSRFGFVKMAIRTGSSLVPVFGFGENQIFDQAVPELGSLAKKFQDKVKEWFGFSLPLCYGRSVFNYNFGLLPHRKPINIVVGKPIEVKRVADPSIDLVREVHAKYMEALLDLYERNKCTYYPNGAPPLRFV